MKVVNQNQIFLAAEDKREIFGSKIGLVGLLFGCWHKRLSRPFGERGRSYIVCLDCGARKHFDQNTLTTYGKFHFPPKVPTNN